MLRKARAPAVVVLLAHVCRRPQRQLVAAECWIYVAPIILLALMGFSACGTGQEAQPLRLSLEVPPG
jgi:hypothetical protein